MAVNSTSVAIKSRSDIRRCAESFRDIGESYDLRVLPWHNLGSSSPMADENGEYLCSSVFGWDGENEWWHGLVQRRTCVLADLCRYQSGPFWASVHTQLQSRNRTPGLDTVDLSRFWKNTEVRSILTVPVHMHLGQVGLVGFVSRRDDVDFGECLEHLEMLSHTFLCSYVQVTAASKHGQRHPPLSDREIECLAWAFDGKTDRDIAEITGRSYATIRFYISRSAVKLGTINRAQTLAKAATLGYLSHRI